MDLQRMAAYVERLEGDIHLVLPRFFAKAGKKTVHDFRVSVKRLRAVCALLEGTLDAFSSEEVELLLCPLYKRAGEVRKWQLIYQRLHQLEARHHAASTWAVLAKKQKQHAIDALIALANGFNITPLRATCAAARSRLIHLDIPRFAYALDHYWDDQLRSLHACYVQRSQVEKSWHEARRLLKQLIYQIELLHVAMPTVVLPKDLVKELKKHQDQLGKWHDAYQIWTTLLQMGLEDAALADVFERRLERQWSRATRFFEAWPHLRESLRALGKAYAQSAQQVPTPAMHKHKSGKRLRESIFPKNLNDLLR